MLFFVELRHAPERCPGVAPEIRDRMLRMAQNRDQVLESHGCSWVGGWISPTPHLTFITLDGRGPTWWTRPCGTWVWPPGTLPPSTRWWISTRQ